jgi:hypothetical protein
VGRRLRGRRGARRRRSREQLRDRVDVQGPNNSQTEWIAFGPDGIPVGFRNNGGPCELGKTGTGAGAIYLNNDQRDTAVVMSPLGTVKVHSFERGQMLWTE